MAKRKTKIEIEESSGNVFEDLGFPNPDQELLKARLTLQIYRVIKQRKLTQAQGPWSCFRRPDLNVDDFVDTRAFCCESLLSGDSVNAVFGTV